MADIAIITPDPVAASHPAHFFRHAAARIARYSLGQIEQCNVALAEPVRIQALHILTYALQLEGQWLLARDLLLRLADKLEHSSYRAGWLPLLEQGLHLSQQHQDAKTTAELHLRIGYLLQLSGQFEAACTHYAAGATTFAQVGQPERRARVLNRYAYTARQQQKPTQAWQLVQEALALVADDHPEQGNAYLVRGWLAVDERHWQAACADFAKAVAILRRNGTPYQLACALRDLAVPLHMLQRDEEAISVFQQAAALFGQLDNHFQQAVVKMNCGIIHLAQQPALALDFFAGAEPIFRQLHDQENLGKLYLNQGLAYRVAGKLHRSTHLLQASISLFEQIGNPDWLANAVDELGVTFLQLGETQQAITTFQEALTILSTAPEPTSYRRNQIARHLQTALHSTP
jgi:tetratricopeptide (TPR) repeat protein